jgi:G:T-mismatch repair DNA endonuclease (very short patch repair protein)
MARSYVRRQGERKAQHGPRRRRVPVPRWYDPYWWIQGSTIEKMVMTEFVRRGIYFKHTPQVNTLGGEVDPSWEPDFLLEQWQIWIEIQGGYFHTLPGQVEADAFRFAAIEAAGWRPIFWWEDDIRTRLNDLMDAVPEFYAAQGPITGERTPGLPFYEGGDGIDHLAGLRKALSNRRKPVQMRSRVRYTRAAK